MRLNSLKVTVQKSDLLTALKKNRAAHTEDTKLARAGFKIELREELVRKLAALDAGEPVNLSIKARKPDTHTEDYDDVIGMLEMATESVIELDHEQFKCWVNDQWDWRDQWAASNSSYITTASLRS